MSILGLGAASGVAAGVAGTATQAQQLAQQRDSTDVQTVRDARRLHEMAQANIDALEEGDEFQSTDQLQIDGHLPEHQSPEQQQQGHHKPSPEAVAAAAEPVPPAAATPDDGELYHHIDVQA